MTNDMLTWNRMGYGAMQLPGPGVWGPPRDHDAAVAVVREAVDRGVNHIDTGDLYGPHVANEIIREALHPYPSGLYIVTKVGGGRGPDKSWHAELSPAQVVASVHENLRTLGLDVLEVVNLRFFTASDEVAPPLEALVELREQGLIRHLGISEVTLEQFETARSITDIVCVQNHYNLAHRVDDPILDRCAELGLAFVPYFPMGGFSPLQSEALDAVATRLDATPQQVSLAWLLQRSPNVLLIPGTSSVTHLHENLAAADLELPADAVAELDAIGSTAD